MGIIVALVVLVAIVAIESRNAASVPSTGDTNQYPINSDPEVQTLVTTDPTPSVPDTVNDFAHAIAHAEGYGIPGAIPTRANNPGDLVLGDLGNGVLGDQGITVFATADAGWAALVHQIVLVRDGRSHVYTSSMTIAEFGAKYTATQRPEWVANVLDYLTNNGYPWVDETTTLSDLLS